jgi:hypothetical protein
MLNGFRCRLSCRLTLGMVDTEVLPEGGNRAQSARMRLWAPTGSEAQASRSRRSWLPWVASAASAATWLVTLATSARVGLATLLASTPWA